MKLIQSKAELLTQGEGLEGVYQMIELAGRTCYKSEDKITQDSSSEFVKRMINSGHTAMLEHGTIYLEYHVKDPSEVGDSEYSNMSNTLHTLAGKYANNKYSKVFMNQYHDYITITTNYRVIVENNWYEDLKYICNPNSFHERRISIRFTTDRGVSHELVRHRVFSFAQESTRYCNYTKDKFGNEITFIKPSWFDDMSNIEINDEWNVGDEFTACLENAEDTYNLLIKIGCTPQQARQVLPNALKTEIIMTGFVSDWKHFFDLRYFGTTGKPHPDMLELSTKAKDVLDKANLWSMITNA